MNSSNLVCGTLSLLAWVLVSTPAFGQSSGRFTLARSVVSAGGATFSNSGRFQLGSTFAQPVAAVPASTRFALQGGFWIVPAPVIFSPAKTGNDFKLSFETEPGQSYLVEYSNSLLNPDWQPLPVQAGDGTIKTVTDNAPGIPRRFYRIRQQ